ncbi:MAG: hypothetical protein M3552_02225 [Planctomycetota bacterium]|nr:hypothetical protein [Planctomycetaceae bacterium]MDQ3329464.1 hypothetical protein [Planctomycetota bacterium]
MTILRLPRRNLCVLTLVFGAGCANSQQFTAGRLPYGGGDVTAASPRDPFLTPGAAEPRAHSQVADASPQMLSQQAAFPGTSNNPAMRTQTAPQTAALPSSPYRDDNPFQQPTPVHNTHQAAYVPTDSDDPFAARPTTMSAPSQTAPSIEQMSFEMPVGVTASNPFAEVQGQANPAMPYQAPMPQIVPLDGATDSWQPSVTTTSSAQADEFLPPR